MKLTDYKFWYITRDDDGFITKCAIRFYEGEMITRDITDPFTQKPISITRYTRTKRLQQGDLSHLKGQFMKERSENDVKIYIQEDFGKIKTDDELRSFLNKELKKDKSRKPIKEQR